MVAQAKVPGGVTSFTDATQASNELIQIGTVSQITGQVSAKCGEEFQVALEPGDPIYLGTQLETGPDGMIVIELLDGTRFDLGRESVAVLDREVYDPDAAEVEAAVADAELSVEELQAALLEGADPTQLMEATAAGAPGAGGDTEDSSGQPVVIGRDGALGQVVAGFETPPLGFEYPGPPEKDLEPVEEEEVPEPAISVGVDVETSIGGGRPDDVVQLDTYTAGLEEGTNGTGIRTVIFDITLDHAYPEPVTVTYAINSGSADGILLSEVDSTPRAEWDYAVEQLSGKITFEPGETEYQIPVTINSDHYVEVDQNFSIVLSDPVNATIGNDTATAVIINDDFAPVAEDDTFETTEDAGPAGSNVIEGRISLEADHDPDIFPGSKDGEVLTVVSVNGNEEAVGQELSGDYGKLVLNADGSYSYTPNSAELQSMEEGDSVVDTFTYQISDGANLSNTATLTITVRGLNDAPTSSELPDQENVDGAEITLDVRELGLFDDVDLGADPDASHEDVLSFSADSLPPGLSIDPETGVISGQIDSDASEGSPYKVTVTATDTEGASTSQSFDWAVTNPGPVAEDDPGIHAEPDSILTYEDGAMIPVDVLANDYDTPPDFDTLTIISLDASQTVGEVAIIDNGKAVTYDPGSEFQYLAEGERTQTTFDYTIEDDQGATDTATVTVTIIGTNDGPKIESYGTDASGAVFERLDGAPDENLGNITDSGAIAFSDIDLIDTHSASVAPQGSGYLGALTLGAVDQESNSVGWTYSVPAGDLDYLREGQELVEVYDVAVSDGLAEAVQRVTVTITGTNDQPILSIDAEGSVTEDVVLSDSGELSFEDVDHLDLHTLSSSSNEDAEWSGGDLSDAQVEAITGGFSLNPEGDGWSYSVANSDINFLADGETITFSYDVTVKDDSGAINDSDTKTVTITINGTNDGPELNVTPDADTVHEAGLVPAGSSAGLLATSVTGSFTIGDPDGLDDVKSISIGSETFAIGSAGLAGLVGESVDVGYGLLSIDSYANGTYGFTYTLGDRVDNALPPATDAGYLESFNIEVSDGIASVESQVDINIVDDEPVITGAAESTSISVSSPIDSGSLGAKVGADLEGAKVTLSAPQAAVLDKDGDPVTSGGQPLYYYPGDNGSLYAATSIEAEPVMWFVPAIDESGNASYTVSMVGLVDHDTEIADTPSIVNGTVTQTVITYDEQEIEITENYSFASLKNNMQHGDKGKFHSLTIEDDQYGSTLTMTLKGYANGELDGVQKSTTGIGVNSNFINGSDAEVLAIEFDKAINIFEVTIDQLDEGEQGAWSTDGGQTWTTFDGFGTGSSEPNDQVITVDPDAPFTEVLFKADSNSDYSILPTGETSVTYWDTVTIEVPVETQVDYSVAVIDVIGDGDWDLSLQAGVEDSDGDALESPIDFDVNVDAALTYDAVSLAGTTIDNFSVEQGDILDLSSVFTGGELIDDLVADGSLSVDLDGTTATVNFDLDGSAGSEYQLEAAITLTGLEEGVTIEQLLAQMTTTPDA